jgi:periplasmic protein TonB
MAKASLDEDIRQCEDGAGDRCLVVRQARVPIAALSASVAAHALALLSLAFLLPHSPIRRPSYYVLAYFVKANGGGRGLDGRGVGAGMGLSVGVALRDGVKAAAVRGRAIGASSHRRSRRARGHDSRDTRANRDRAGASPRHAASAASPRGGPPGSVAPAVREGTDDGVLAHGGAAGEGVGAGGAGQAGSGDSGGGGSARYAYNPAPRYPESARVRNEQGTVVLRVLVGADGLVERVEVAHSSGFASLDRAAIETVRARWRFLPAKHDGIDVESWVLVPIQFTLRGPSASS